MKTYACHRCGKIFEGRLDYCPRCGQHFVYQRKGEYFDALGNKVLLGKDGHIKKTIRNPKSPK